MVVQTTLDEFGRSIPKCRPTHDRSFNFSESNSTNDRLDRHSIPPLHCGFCLNRIFHSTHSLRFHEPTKSIVMSKIDFKSAYRRGTMPGNLSVQSITLLCGFALLIRCLPFGGSHFPSLWCVMSEMITDLGNDRLTCPDWDEKKSFSPRISKLKSPTLHPKNVPFAKALQADVTIPPYKHGSIDGFIDNIVTLGCLCDR